MFEGQTITTDARGLVQIVFADETRMVVGPNSQLVIERYLMRDPNTVSEFVANALGGTFRFLSGNSPSDAYRINTPGGTIGVRGTAFDLTIDNLLRQIFILLYPQGRGGLYHCVDGPGGTQRCTDLDDACGALAIANPGNGWNVAAMPGYMFDWTVFPFATQQLQLVRQYRVRGAFQCLSEPEPEPEPEPEEEPDPCNDPRGIQQRQSAQQPFPCLG